MPKFQIRKSIEINAPAAQTRQAIQDYNHWEAWSPWLCMEPSATVEVEGKQAIAGHAYSWQGDMVGAGRMELASIDGNTDHMDLEFLKPFKSKAKVKFETTAIDANTTSVTWHMDSSLPFFLFFMVGTMKAMIGMDYERGLKLLKEYIETGKVTSSTKVVGVVDVPAMHYAGVAGASHLSDIANVMENSIKKLKVISAGITTQELVGTIYHDMNIKTQHCKYTVIAPVAESDANGSITKCQALKIVHTGSYQHLGNAWATANSYQRHHKFKKNKQVAPFEIYVNNPDTVAAKDLVTEIYLPVNAPANG